MLTRLRSLSSRFESAAVAGIPLAILLVVGIWDMANYRARHLEAARFEHLVSLSVEASHLVHALQIERGASAGFLGSGGQRFGDVVGAQRRRTDERLQRFRTLVGTISPEELAVEVSSHLAELDAPLEGIEPLRRDVDALRIPVLEEVERYTALTTILLDLGDMLTRQAPGGELANEGGAFAALLHSKERAGLERALVTTAFARDMIDVAELDRFSRLVARQTLYLEIFLDMASDEHRALLERTMTDPVVSAVARMRERLVARGMAGGFEIDPLEWFETKTRTIELLTRVEKQLAEDLRANARAASAEAERAYLIVALLLAGGVAVAWQTWRHLFERRRGEARIHYLAEYDTLSGTLNRASFEKALGEAVEAAKVSGTSFAVHCIDLDRFKEINDTLGHSVGDRVLREVAARLGALCRPENRLARLGGDEFALLQLAPESVRDVERFGRRLVEALAPPIEIDARRTPCRASVGAALFSDDVSEGSELLHKADLAMYRSKSTGRGRFSFYDEALDREFEERRLMTLDLHTALVDGALSLHYQPLFEADEEGGRASGYEALMRWRHPGWGDTMPALFIPLAEESGLIESLGSWALELACRDAAGWTNGARVAVNLSVAQFREGAVDIVEVVGAALARSGLAADRLELEITESLLIGDAERVAGVLERLSAMGVRIAMDDFGTGYSSLSYLWRFPFDKVKIDRSFVQGLDGEGGEKVSLIVASIVSLAHSLGMRVNAEGVETEGQCETLRRLGCDELQGFLLGRPAPVPV